MFEWMIPLLVMLAVFLSTLSLLQMLRAFKIKRHAQAVLNQHSDGHSSVSDKLTLEKLFFRILPLGASFQRKWLSTRWMAKMEQKLMLQPKWQHRDGAQWWVAKELGFLFGWLVGWLSGVGWFITILMACAGLYLPELWLKERNASRVKSIMRELPDALDLLAACMEAGLGFEQAVATLQERGKQGFLLYEFNEMMRTIRMGRSRQDALRTMGTRIDDPDFTTFTTSLIQAERMGVSVAEILKNQATLLRNKRSQTIEKLAMEAPVKMLFPLIAFIFPIVFIVLFGPVVLRFMQGF